MSDSPQSMAPGRVGPTIRSERIDLIDVLRGFAVFGILVANMAAFSGMQGGLQVRYQSLDQIVFVLIRFFVEAKFYTLFSFLFGWGFAVQMRRMELRQVGFFPTYLRRLLALLLFGIVHGTLIWTGDILTLYALLGFLLLLFRRRSIRFLLLSSILAFALAIVLRLPWEPIESFRNSFQELVSPHLLNRYSQALYANGSFLEITRLRVQDFMTGMVYSFFALGNVFGMFLLGLAAGKARVFAQLGESLPSIRRALVPVFLLGLLFNAIFVLAILQPDRFPLDYQDSIRVGARTIGAPLLTMTYMIGITLLYQRPRWRRTLDLLAPVGRTALSNYILQSVLCTLIFYGYGLGYYGSLKPMGGLVLTLAIYALQLRLSSWWLERYQYGPMEWIWRILTYGEAPVLRRRYPFEDKAVRPARARKSLQTRWILISISAFLIIWCAGLITWGRSLSGELVNSQSLYSAIRSVAPDLESDTALSKANREEGEIQPTLLERAVAIPRNPEPLVASGELGALAAAFNADRTLADVVTLTSAQFAGRQAGAPGGEAAGAFLAERFAELGLIPAGEEDTYFQSFIVPYSVQSEMPKLAVLSLDTENQTEFRLEQDYAVVAGGYSGAGEISASVIWVDDCGPEDFNRTDVVGMVVFCQRTQGIDADRNAIEHGAAGLMLLNEEDDRPFDFAYPRFEPLVPEPIPTMLVGERVATALLAGSGISLQDLKLSSTPRLLKSEVLMKVFLQGSEGCEGGACQGRNVLGLLLGSDPVYSDQVVVLSAHYDHMGSSPDGTIWPGANDDASGVAALLEIARIWQEQGYTPKRSVLFAAWDAEELGLLGSRAYLAAPTIPLDSIVADIQLDMIGAGGSTLAISGDGRLGELLEGAAEANGVESVMGEFGGSDHISFMEHGLDAALLIWHDPADQYTDYHRPVDTAAHIDLERLRQAGTVAHLALLSLVDGEPTIQSLLDQRASAMLAGDLSAYLATSDPAQAVLDRSWYATAEAEGLSDFQLELSDLVLTGDGAYGDVKVTLAYSQREGENVVQREIHHIVVRFTRFEQTWRWSGPDVMAVTSLDQAETAPQLTSGLDVQVLATQPDGLTGLDTLQPSLEWLGRFSSRLELQIPNGGLKIEIFSNQNELCAFSVPEPDCTRSVWIGPGTIRLTDWVFRTGTNELENTLARWLLFENGLREDIAPWLWNGLPIAFRLLENPDQGESYYTAMYESLSEERPTVVGVASWAAAEYLKDRLGWTGIGRFVETLGLSCERNDCTLPEVQSQVLSAALGMTKEEFETAWWESWIGRFEAVERELQATLDRRTQAVLNAEMNTFLRTVDPSIKDLRYEQQQYYLRIRATSPSSLQWSAEPRLLYPDGRVLAMVGLTDFSSESQGPDGLQTGQKSYVLFTPGDAGLRWAGFPLQELRHGRTSIFFPSGYKTVAEDLLEYVELAYAQLQNTLGILSSRPLTLKIYDGRDAISNSIPILTANASPDLWVTPGGSIKIGLLEPSPDEDDALRSRLAEALIRSILTDAGLDVEWLVRGVSLYLAPELDGRARMFSATRDLRSLATALSHHELPRLEDLPGDEQLDDDSRALADAQAWDAVRTLIESYGPDVLREVLQQISGGTEFDEAFNRATGVTPVQFETIWMKSYLLAHLDPSWPDLAAGFNPQEAMAFLAELTASTYEGRGTGTPGADAAAHEIQAQFQHFGLLPPVPIEQVNNSEPVEGAAPDRSDGASQGNAEVLDSDSESSYFQQFSIYRVPYQRAPALQMTFTNTGSVRTLAYREEFIDLPQSYDYAGPVRGDLIWVDSARGYPEAGLDGKIVIQIEVGDPATDALQAVEKNAAGLILVSRRNLVDSFFMKSPVPVEVPESVGIPVFRINQGVYQDLLREAGRTEPELLAGPPAAKLGITVRLDLPLLPPREIQTANVLGLLRGSDPDLADEVVILGAHYDHVGDDPDTWICNPNTQPSEEALASGECRVLEGIRYPGANDDASGLAVLLEIARLWQVTGYRPARSVLFAAWGAQEPGQYGSEYYSENPIIPLADTVAMIQLDSVAGGRGYYLEVHGTPEQDGLLTESASLLEGIADVRLSLVRKSLNSSDFQSAEKARWLTWPLPTNEETSDHLPFRSQGVPSVLLTWRGASEANLPESEADEVQPERLAMTGRMAALLVMSLAR